MCTDDVAKNRGCWKRKKEPEELDGVEHRKGFPEHKKKLGGWLRSLVVKEWSGTRSEKRCEKSSDQVLASIYCNNWFPLSLDMAPKWQTWAQHVSCPPSHQVCLRQ